MVNAFRRMKITYVFLVLVLMFSQLMGTLPVSAADTNVDEIHSQFGDDAAHSMWVEWRGPANYVDYGPTVPYASSTFPTQSTPQPISPTDLTTQPFMRIQLTGLTANTEYHYRIGASGTDHTFKTAPGPTDSFTWVDIGDTASSYYNPASDAECNKPWMNDVGATKGVWHQIADENPDFVTHGGDISYANECGPGAIHQFYQDIKYISEKRAFEQVWGNHEYGPVSPSVQGLWGTQSNDSYVNYKGRNVMPNAQTLPSDLPDKTNPPGCSGPTMNVNYCQGSDYGSFEAGGILFLMLPENHFNAYYNQTEFQTSGNYLASGWGQYADGKMSAAKTNPNIKMVVTLAHQPAYSSLGNGQAYNVMLRPVLDALGDKWSPTQGGKYVLAVNHHIHGAEVFDPRVTHGVVHVSNGGGGTERADYSNGGVTGSVWRQRDLSHLNVTVTGNTMQLKFICGPRFEGDMTGCEPGTPLYEQPISTTPVPVGPAADLCANSPAWVGTEYVTNRSTETVGTQGWAPVNNGSVVSLDSTNVCDGYSSIKTTVKSGNTPTSIGIESSPHWVAAAPSPTATIAGGKYYGSVWVKSNEANKPITLTLQEKTAANVNVNKAEVIDTNTTTAWHKVVVGPYIAAAGGGNAISFKASIGSPASTTTLYADQMSLVLEPTPPPIQPRSLCTYTQPGEKVTNRSVESNMEGWGGLYNSSSSVERDGQEACDGSYSLKVRYTPATPATSTSYGFSNAPAYVDGVSTSTIANSMYTGSVWVKGISGRVVNYVIRETKTDQVGTLVGSTTKTMTLNGSWQQLTNAYQASGTGNKLALRVYGVGASPGDYFNADNMSLGYAVGQPPIAPQTLCSEATSDSEILLNKSFETDLSNWDQFGTGTGHAMLTRDSSDACDGSYSMKMVYDNSGSSNMGVDGTNNITTGSGTTTATGSVWIKATTATTYKVRITEFNGTTAVTNSTTDYTPTANQLNNWQKVSVAYTTNTPGRQLKFSVFTPSPIPNNTTFKIDQASMVRSVLPLAPFSTECDVNYANEKVTNRSVETTLAPWNGTYNSSSVVTRDGTVAGNACHGSYSVKVALPAGVATAPAIGFQNPGTTYLIPSVAGKIYKASAFLKYPALTAGKTINMSICERTTTSCTQTQTLSTSLPSNMQWGGFGMKPPYLTATGGKFIQIKIWLTNPTTGDYFQADNMSVVTTN